MRSRIGAGGERERMPTKKKTTEEAHEPASGKKIAKPKEGGTPNALQTPRAARS